MQVCSSGCIGADMVEDTDEYRVRLSIYFLKFDRDEVYLSEHSGREKVGSGIEAVQNFPLIVLYNGFQLEDVSYQ